MVWGPAAWAGRVVVGQVAEAVAEGEAVLDNFALNFYLVQEKNPVWVRLRVRAAFAQKLAAVVG